MICAHFSKINTQGGKKLRANPNKICFVVDMRNYNTKRKETFKTESKAKESILFVQYWYSLDIIDILYQSAHL